jgi:hypothetical protein
MIRNRQLLWFPLLLALVLAGQFMLLWGCNVAFGTDGGSLVIGSPAVVFLVELPAIFFFVFLLAGIYLCLSSGRPAPFFHALVRARVYLRPLTLWSFCLAIATTLLFLAGLNLSGLPFTAYAPFDAAPWFQPLNAFSTLQAFLNLALVRFPFNATLSHVAYASLGVSGGTLHLFNAYNDTIRYFPILLAINVLMFVVTLFVVPLLILEKRRLKEAVCGSFALVKGNCAEVASCGLGLCIILLMASLTFGLFHVAGFDGVENHGSTIQIYWERPAEVWMAIGFLYTLGLAGLATFIAAIGGIAAYQLFGNAKQRERAP